MDIGQFSALQMHVEERGWKREMLLAPDNWKAESCELARLFNCLAADQHMGEVNGAIFYTDDFHQVGGTSVPCAASPEKASRNRSSRVQHTSSLDTILGSYLMGQWPRDAEGLPLSHMSDKSTQTPVSWHESEVGKVADQKRSASWNNMDHRREGSPLASFPVLSTKISPSFHNSLESINQELEEIFVKEQGDEELLRILDVPDGHRAPLPFQRNTEDSLLPRLENNSSPCSSLSLSPSPSNALRQSPHSPARMITDEDLSGVLAKLVLENKGKLDSLVAVCC
ncbi:hypothetical protein E2320_002848 [Naja naja]|nr:hypothetical protein E2320_002848 [Naja naja]